MPEAVAEQPKEAGTTADNLNAKPDNQDTKKAGFKLSSTVKWIVIPLVPIALAIGGFMYWSYSSVRESTDDAQIDGHIYPVSAMVDGTITDVLVENNQYVEAGTVLAHIDPRYYEAAVEKAQGDVGEATATEKENRAGVPITSINTSTQLSGAEAGVAEQTAKIATAGNTATGQKFRTRRPSAAHQPGRPAVSASSSR